MDFGIRLHLTTEDYQEVKRFAVEAERLGFHSVWVNDHLLPPGGPADGPFMESWMILSAIATGTQRVKLGTLVTPVHFRLPSLLAKMSASLDYVSEGRFILGIGAGWYKQEYETFGIPFPNMQTRIEQLEEAAQIVKLLWTEKKASFDGRHYRIRDAINEPKPVQKPHPPLLIGGTNPRILDVVAKHADVWNISYPSSPARFERSSKAVDDACQNAGRNPKTLRRSVLLESLIATDGAAFDKLLSESGRTRGMKLDDYRQRLSSGVVGLPEECIERVRYYQTWGVDLIVLSFPSNNDLEQLRRFAENVIRQTN